MESYRFCVVGGACSQKWHRIILSRPGIDPGRRAVVAAGGGVSRHGGSRVRERGRKGIT